MTDEDPLLRLDAAAFAAQVGTTFRLHHDPPATLELRAVDDVGSSADAERFSLLFHGGADFLGQGMRTMDHDALGELTVFLVPVEREGEGYVYEASFNRLRRA